MELRQDGVRWDRQADGPLIFDGMMWVSSRAPMLQLRPSSRPQPSASQPQRTSGDQATIGPPLGTFFFFYDDQSLTNHEVASKLCAVHSKSSSVWSKTSRALRFTA